MDFVLPISLVDENMKRAHHRDALLHTKFWWKTDVLPKNKPYSVSDLQETDFKESNKQYNRDEKLG